MTIKEETRKKVLRIHGSILIVIGIALAANATIGTYLGVGNFSFLKDNEFALVGLFQAYLLMAIIGVSLWIGSTSTGIRKFHIIGALAHFPPLAANIMFWHLFLGMGMTTLAAIGTTFHCLFICIETIAGISADANKEEESKQST